MTRFAGPVAVFLLVAGLAVAQDIRRGTLKSVDADKKTVTITVDGKDETLAITADTKVLGAKAVTDLKPGMAVMFKADTRDGKPWLWQLGLPHEVHGEDGAGADRAGAFSTAGAHRRDHQRGSGVVDIGIVGQHIASGVVAAGANRDRARGVAQPAGREPEAHRDHAELLVHHPGHLCRWPRRDVRERP